MAKVVDEAGKLTIARFESAAERGDVVRVADGDLVLYCYSARCVHERRWDDVTRAARGIVFDRWSGRVVARPFDKFFNLGETSETMPDAVPATSFRIEEKLDGSLGIVFFHDGAWRVVTKGSFASEQARFAQDSLLPVLRLSSAPTDLTLLFELIYPENRIVVDYGERREAVLLSARDPESGDEVDAGTADVLAEAIGANRPEVLPETRNLLELPMADDLGMEGYVVRFDDDRRVKVKSPRYVQVHRLLEYRSPRRILDMIESGDYESIRDEIPDALASDFDDISAALRLSIRQVEGEAERVFESISDLRGDRKAFALAAKDRASGSALPLVFALLDGKPTHPLAIRAVRRELRADVTSNVHEETGRRG